MLSPALWLVLAGAVGAAVALRALRRRRRDARLVRCRAQWGRIRERERDMAAIAGYDRARASDTTSRSLDDRTWDDLNMNDVFAVLDRTESVVGQQVLYRRLRSSPTDDHLQAFEALVTTMHTDVATREQAQIALARLGDRAGYDLWGLTQPHSLHVERWYVVFPIAAVTMLGAVALVPVWPPAVLALAAGTMTSLVLRAAIARRLLVVSGAFRQLGPLLAVAQTLASIQLPGAASIVGTMSEDGARLSRLRRIAGWVARDSSAAAAGDLGALLLEYLNLLFCLDANAFLLGARELGARGPDLLRVIDAVGDIDAALSVASYRAGTDGWTRPRFAHAGAPTIVTGIRHPLLTGAVPNSIVVSSPRGVIITGSNMSGKSTFLRTVGVTAILAQTINTCVADAYEAPVVVVKSCIGRADDPATGKSFYLVEIESVLALVRAAETTTTHLFLFDELFRGTNAVERIAAGESVLRALVAPGEDGQASPHVVLAATHDQELVDLLGSTYAAYHFTDTIDDAGLAFDYRLQPGPATTRNAIALLQLRGAPRDLVAHALERAAELDRARRTDR